MFAPIKKLVHTNAFYTAVLLLILLVMKNVLRPYVGYDQYAEFDWYDMLLIVVVIISTAASAISAYKYSLRTAESLYAATKTGFYSALYASLCITIASLALPMFITQSYKNQLADSFAGPSMTSLIVFNIVGILMMSALGAFAGFLGGLAGWVIGVLTVHGIIKRDNVVEHSDESVIQEAVQDPTTYTYDTTPTDTTEEMPTPIEEAPTSYTPQVIEVPVSETLASAAPVPEPLVTPIVEPTPQPEARITEYAPTVETEMEPEEAPAHFTPFPPEPVPVQPAQTQSDATPLTYIHFMPEHDVQTLQSVGVASVEELLDRANSHPKREVLSAQSGIDPSVLLKYANVSDLMRLPGVDSSLAQLMEHAGVDTIVELAKRNPQNLHDALQTTNQNESLTHAVPSVDQIRGLVNAAKVLGREITH